MRGVPPVAEATRDGRGFAPVLFGVSLILSFVLRGLVRGDEPEAIESFPSSGTGRIFGLAMRLVVFKGDGFELRVPDDDSGVYLSPVEELTTDCGAETFRVDAGVVGCALEVDTRGLVDESFAG
jgi:hypothetical protein